MCKLYLIPLSMNRQSALGGRGRESRYFASVKLAKPKTFSSPDIGKRWIKSFQRNLLQLCDPEISLPIGFQTLATHILHTLQCILPTPKQELTHLKYLTQMGHLYIVFEKRASVSLNSGRNKPQIKVMADISSVGHPFWSLEEAGSCVLTLCYRDLFNALGNCTRTHTRQVFSHGATPLVLLFLCLGWS